MCSSRAGGCTESQWHPIRAHADQGGLGARGLQPSTLGRRCDGLPSDVVQAFAETPDNTLWIGTTNGLVRFDGNRFRYYAHENTPALGADSAFCLTVTRDGTLWIGIEGGGLVRYRDGHFREFTAADGLSDNVVRAIFEDRDGLLWVGADHGLFQLHGERLVRIDGTNLVPELSVHTITQESNGAIWVGGTSLLRIPQVRRECIEFPFSRTKPADQEHSANDGRRPMGGCCVGAVPLRGRPPCARPADSEDRKGSSPDARRHFMDWHYRRWTVQPQIRRRAGTICRRPAQ